jgi:hypothetical protein
MGKRVVTSAMIARPGVAGAPGRLTLRALRRVARGSSAAEPGGRGDVLRAANGFHGGDWSSWPALAQSIIFRGRRRETIRSRCLCKTPKP